MHVFAVRVVLRKRVPLGKPEVTGMPRRFRQKCWARGH